MAFEANQKKISQLLSGDRKYLIPRYQRKYVWEEKQWRELLDDLKYCLRNENEDSNSEEWSHFLGSFVFERNDASGKRTPLDSLIVVDGQQRLTTILIMLSVVCSLYNKLGLRDRFNGVIKYILGSDDLGKSYSRIENLDLKNFHLIVDEATNYSESKVGKDFSFGAVFLNRPKDNQNIKNCFSFFYDNIWEMIKDKDSTENELTKIMDKIRSLEVIEILATNQRESFNIFEILNARGVDLQQHELIKNYIFKYLQPRSDIDGAKLKWADLEETLYVQKDSVLPLFFNHYLSHRYEKPTSSNTEFRIVKEKCGKENIRELLDDILSKAKLYRLFYEPEMCPNKVIKEVLEFFKDNNHRQFRPVFLSVLSACGRKDITVDMTERFFVFMKNFYFGYGVVCKGKSNALNDIIYEYAPRIEIGDSKNQIKEFMERIGQYYPQYNTFCAHFSTLGYSRKSKLYKTTAKKHEIQYILRAFENHWQAKNMELNVNVFTIEHIGNDDGTEAHCHIGNLLPLAEKVNEKVGTERFSEKLKRYSKSNYISVQKFLEHYGQQSDWTNESIQKRGSQLAKVAYTEIWKLNKDLD